ncbi:MULTISPECIES: hypothetical protein [Thermoactinomyces]|jgi:hypothetical protein|nr:MULTISPECIES: hypothetical protein [Thermoactinomyces]
MVKKEMVMEWCSESVQNAIPFFLLASADCRENIMQEKEHMNEK